MRLISTTLAKLARSCAMSSPVSRFLATTRLPAAMPAQLTRMRSTPWAARAFVSASSTEALLRHVASGEQPLDFDGDLLAALAIHVEERNLHALAGEPSRRRLAEAGGASPVTTAEMEGSSFITLSKLRCRSDGSSRSPNVALTGLGPKRRRPERPPAAASRRRRGSGRHAPVLIISFGRLIHRAAAQDGRQDGGDGDIHEH